MRKTNQKGFTLIELITVIILIALLSLLIIPKVIVIMENQKTKNCLINASKIEKIVRADLISNEKDGDRTYFVAKGKITDQKDQEEILIDGKVSIKGKFIFDSEMNLTVDKISCEGKNIIKKKGEYIIEP